MSRVGSNRRGVNGIRVEFLPGFTTLQILVEIQKMTNEMQCEHEQVKGRIIFMSMYNVIVWREKGNIELCSANSRTVAGHAKRFGKGHRSFLGEEQKRNGTDQPRRSRMDKEMMLLNTCCSTLAKSGHPAFRGTSALERRTLKSKGRRKLSIHSCEDSKNC